MQSEDKNIKNNKIPNAYSKRYIFDFEEFSWDSNSANKCHITRNALKKIENERHNIEKDLKSLEAIEREKSKQKDLMISLLKLKEKLEKNHNLNANN